MRRGTASLCVAALLALSFAGMARADVVVSWGFETRLAHGGGAGDPNICPSTLLAGVSSTNIVQGAYSYGVIGATDPTPRVGVTAFDPGDLDSSNWRPTTSCIYLRGAGHSYWQEANAFGVGSYFTITLAATGGGTLDLTGVDGNEGSHSNFWRHTSYYTSTDGGTTWTDQTPDPAVRSQMVDDTIQHFSCAFASPLTGVSGPIIIAVVETTDDSGSALLDNLEFTGTYTPVPEPATMGLLLIGGVALAIRRRRR